MQLFFKQTLQNKCWVTRISLYPCVRLATLQVCLTEKICPWTAVQQEPQRLGKARGFEVLQSVGLAEINLEESEGSALAPLSPSPSCGHSSDRDKSQMHGHTSVFTQWTAGSAAEVENCLTHPFLLKNDATLQKILKKRKMNHASFYHPNRSVFIHILHRGTE